MERTPETRTEKSWLERGLERGLMERHSGTRYAGRLEPFRLVPLWHELKSGTPDGWNARRGTRHRMIAQVLSGTRSESDLD